MQAGANDFDAHDSRSHLTNRSCAKLHADFTSTSDVPAEKIPALIDRYGHGTHVAGIIAGEQRAEGAAGTPATMRAVVRSIEGYEEGIRGLAQLSPRRTRRRQCTRCARRRSRC
jgi:subtilisin family serine protease